MTAARLTVVGAGGHGREAFAVARAGGLWSTIELVDDGPVDLAALERIEARLVGDVETLRRDPTPHVIAIGDPIVRRQVADRIGGSALAVCLVDPRAVIGPDVELAPGAMAYPGSVCTTNVRIGRHSHLNCGAVVSHDCRVGDFVSVSPGVMLNGGVQVGDGAFLGTGATVLPGVRVGQGAIVGAGAVVLDDVAPGTTVVGVPAHRVEREITVIAT